MSSSRLIAHPKIVNKNMTSADKHLFLKKVIKEAFAPVLIKNNLRNLFILKIPRDTQETLSFIADLTWKLLIGLKDKYWIFHASALSYNGQATIALGEANSGKSSFCFIAGLLGAKIISDEPVLIDKKSHLVFPFRYLIKIDYFCKNFPKWAFSPEFDFNQSRFTKKLKHGDIDFNLFTPKDLNILNIQTENRTRILKNIVFLEEKRYDSVMHLSRHCLNEKQDLLSCLGELSSLVQGKKIRFLPNLFHFLNDRETAKKLLNEICINPGRGL